MQVFFQSRHADAAPLRNDALARVRFALRRLRAVVAHARVQMSDVNAARGGVDKRCRVELPTRSDGAVVITTLARDWRTALDLSLGRVTQSLLRRMRRRQWQARGRADGAARA